MGRRYHKISCGEHEYVRGSGSTDVLTGMLAGEHGVHRRRDSNVHRAPDRGES